MHSPLPDASALENGIVEDERPSRLSRVQENVRHLLRNSVISSRPASTLVNTPKPLQIPIVGRPVQPAATFASTGPLQSNTSPVAARYHVHPAERHPEVLPSPSSTNSSRTSTERMSPHDQRPVPGVLFPPVSHSQNQAQPTMVNDRAVAALNHPDLDDPSLAVVIRGQSTLRPQHSRQGSKASSRRRRSRHNTQGLLCVLSSLLLAAMVACYIALTATTSDVSPSFHVLFVLGIVLATILFIHSILRICLFNRGHKTRFFMVTPPPRRRRQRGHRGGRGQGSSSSAATESTTAFVPAAPIQVHVTSDEVRPDTREAEPTVGVEIPADAWDKDVRAVMNPPPAYGKWRGSVRANPELLHWQAVPSPTTPDTPSIPSPTYEEAMAAQMSSPPTYRTRPSPPREHGAAHNQPDRRARVEGVPEMVEGRGIGVAE